MGLNLAITPDQVKRTVESVKKSKPVYADMLNFYGRLFELQEARRSRIKMEPLKISQEHRAVKSREKFPLIEIKDFVFDEDEAGKLFIAICDLAEASNPEMAADAKAIIKSFGTVIKPGELFNSFLHGEEEIELRCDLCDGCKKYLKTFDARKTERMIYPPLEQIASLHLDYKAKELGYQSAIGMVMQV